MTNRETRVVELSNCKAEVATFLTWGEKEDINATVLEGSTTNEKGEMKISPRTFVEMKKRSLELTVKNIIFPDGTSQPFSMDWMNSLSVDDGDLLYEEIRPLIEPKKKPTETL